MAMRYKSPVERNLRQAENQLDNLQKQLEALGLPPEQRNALTGLTNTAKGQVTNARKKVELEEEYHGR
jgi:hypothetical protein